MATDLNSKYEEKEAVICPLLKGLGLPLLSHMPIEMNHYNMPLN